MRTHRSTSSKYSWKSSSKPPTLSNADLRTRKNAATTHGASTGWSARTAPSSVSPRSRRRTRSSGVGTSRAESCRRPSGSTRDGAAMPTLGSLKWPSSGVRASGSGSRMSGLRIAATGVRARSIPTFAALPKPSFSSSFTTSAPALSAISGDPSLDALSATMSRGNACLSGSHSKRPRRSSALLCVITTASIGVSLPSRLHAAVNLLPYRVPELGRVPERVRVGQSCIRAREVAARDLVPQPNGEIELFELGRKLRLVVVDVLVLPATCQHERLAPGAEGCPDQSRSRVADHVPSLRDAYPEPIASNPRFHLEVARPVLGAAGLGDDRLRQHAGAGRRVDHLEETVERVRVRADRDEGSVTVAIAAAAERLEQCRTAQDRVRIGGQQLRPLHERAVREPSEEATRQARARDARHRLGEQHAAAERSRERDERQDDAGARRDHEARPQLQCEAKRLQRVAKAEVVAVERRELVHGPAALAQPLRAVAGDGDPRARQPVQ